MNKEQLVFIVGPTAVGKSAVALALANRIGGEIISCDSMQVYKEIHIMNNKPSSEERGEAAHHLLDCVSVEEEFDVVRYSRLATKTIEDILKRSAIPIIVGGSGLYMSILLDGIFDTQSNPEVREELMQEAEQTGVLALYKQLKEVDPQAAAKIHPNDSRRIIRALEVYQASHRPISEWQKERTGLWGQYHIQVFGLNRPRQELYERINQRVEEMFANGLVEEIKKLSQFALSPTAKKTIGLEEVQGYLDKKYSLEETKKKMQQNTRHYAKRQLTWFRKDKRIEWIELQKDSSSENIAEALTHYLYHEQRSH